MLRIPCPWCGPREEVEFRHGGQARAVPPMSVDDLTWSRYLYFRDNPTGPLTERWVHVHGCRRWFNLVRDTLTHEITDVYPVGERREGTR
jgi:heterotetrameric sarcosine oxidase delta subunit